MHFLSRLFLTIYSYLSTMCYDLTSLTEAQLKYARHRSEDPEFIAELERKLALLKGESEAHYHVNAFSHPKLLVFTNSDPYTPKLFTWGLIPPWVKSRDEALSIWNHTLNARAETLFEKPSFRHAAHQRRCLIVVDAFYEHHHLKNKTYPFRIRFKNHEPLTFAGIWEEWIDPETGELFETTTLVTTQGNALMARIHNNPKADGPRMPVILPMHKQDDWLKNDSEENLKQLLIPFSDEALEAYTVRRLRGKEYIGDVEAITEEFKYPELGGI